MIANKFQTGILSDLHNSNFWRSTRLSPPQKQLPVLHTKFLSQNILRYHWFFVFCQTFP